MNKLKRTLAPIRLALPSLLALSATAAWTPLVTTVGTGFGAGYNIDDPNAAAVLAIYDRPGTTPIALYRTKGHYPAGGGGWQDEGSGWLSPTTLVWVFKDSIDSVSVDTYVAGLTDGGSGVGHVSIDWN
jgi:hypothetical protein